MHTCSEARGYGRKVTHSHTHSPLVLIKSDIGNWPQSLGPHRNPVLFQRRIHSIILIPEEDEQEGEGKEREREGGDQ